MVIVSLILKGISIKIILESIAWSSYSWSDVSKINICHKTQS